MRKTILTLVSAAALAVPFVGLTSNAGATAATPTCKTAAGTATFKPPLPIVSSKQTVKSTITAKGTEKSCTGGGVTSATSLGTFKFTKPGNCTTLLSGTGGSTPGTLKLTWNTKATSTASVTLSQVKGKATETKIAGKITAGLFKGKAVSQTLSFAPTSTGGDCTTTPLKQVSYKQVTALVIK